MYGNHFNLWLCEHHYFLCLQEDFVKWKGSLFYRFITTLVDEDVEIRKFGVFFSVFVSFENASFLIHFNLVVDQNVAHVFVFLVQLIFAWCIFC